jgi:UDP-galactopyranose mutase
MKKALIIGGGFAGCTAANILKERGFKCTILEKGTILGGGVRTFFYHGHPYTFGPHHLLIDVDKMYIYDYYAKYLKFWEMDHYNMSYSGEEDKFYTFPLHQSEVNEMMDAEQIKKELSAATNPNPTNFDDYWKGTIGETLYRRFMDGYSKKMWNIPNNKILDEVTFSFKNKKEDNLKSGSKKCFDGKKRVFYPTALDGYNKYFDICSEDVNVVFNACISSIDVYKKKIICNDQVYTGDILVSTISPDILLDYKYGELPYMGRDFMKIILPIEKITPEPYFFIHYPNDEQFTRIFEYKLLTKYKSKNTLIGIEFPSKKNKLYPYPIKSEILKAKKYIDELPADVYSIGRAGKYHYDNQDMIIKDCLDLFINL